VLLMVGHGSSVANRGGGVGGEAMSFDTLPARGVGRSGAGAGAIIGPSGGVSAVRLTPACHFYRKVTRWRAAGAYYHATIPPPHPPFWGPKPASARLIGTPIPTLSPWGPSLSGEPRPQPVDSRHGCRLRFLPPRVAGGGFARSMQLVWWGGCGTRSGRSVGLDRVGYWISAGGAEAGPFQNPSSNWKIEMNLAYRAYMCSERTRRTRICAHHRSTRTSEASVRRSRNGFFCINQVRPKGHMGKGV